MPHGSRSGQKKRLKYLLINLLPPLFFYFSSLADLQIFNHQSFTMSDEQT